MRIFRMRRAVLAAFVCLIGILTVCGGNHVVSATVSATHAETSAASMAMMEVRTNRLLYAKNPTARAEMASTTKIMTAIVVLEHCSLDEVVTVDKRAAGVEGSSIYLAAGEKITVEDLLYGLMLQSGNDAATALAYHVGGTIESFAAMMNETAVRIGAEHTHFVNPHGLHHEDHYTTAEDLALIACYGMRNPAFKKIVGTKEHRASWEGRDYDRILHNKNKILSLYEGGTGVKTGYTKAAGRCLVSSAERDGMEIVCVVLNCGPMFEDCCKLMDQAFHEFKMTEILPAYTHLGKIDAVGSTVGTVNVYSKNAYSYPLREFERNGVHCRIELPDSVKAPVLKDVEIGKIKVFYNNQLLFVEKIYTMEDVKSITFKDHLLGIVGNWLGRV